jgi:hypothetical protein
LPPIPVDDNVGTNQRRGRFGDQRVVFAAADHLRGL